MTYVKLSSKLREFFHQGQPLAYGKAEVILGNTPEPDAVYFISSGYVKIYSLNDDGSELLHIIFGPGDIFPLVWAFLGDTKDGVYYESLSECVLWRISRDWFLKLAHNDTELSFELGQRLAYQTKIFVDRLDNLQFKKANERIAYRLLFLASRFGRKVNDEIIIDVPITHELIANSINLARESVSREFEELEKHHIIMKKNQHIHLLNIDALIEILGRQTIFNNFEF